MQTLKKNHWVQKSNQPRSVVAPRRFYITEISQSSGVVLRVSVRKALKGLA